MNSPASGPPIDTSPHLRSPTKRRWRTGVAIGVAIAGAAFAWFTMRTGNDSAGRYVTAAIDRGDVVAAVTATGVLHPLTQVDVGSEVSGVIRVVNVDFNDRVSKGQVLARLDTAQLQARVLQTQASLESATAGRRQAEATTHESQLNFHRCERLAQTKMCSQQDLDQAEATWLRAQAAEAAAIAQVSQAKANLDADQTALRKADIVSPIDGIVLNRFVEPGQTVAATFQTPLLFTLAEDLSQMQLKVDVDEADIGRVREGQTATFTVDAYPRRRFDARVSAVRFAPKTVEGVVTYEAVLEFDNSALLLRPGMTATADIVTNTLSNVLRVPNAALRVKPPGVVDTAPPSEDPSTRTLWVLSDGAKQPQAVRARIGESDGRYTEVADGAVDVGTRVVTDVTPNEADAANSGMFPRGPHGGH